MDHLDPTTQRRRLTARLEDLEDRVTDLEGTNGEAGHTDSAAELAQEAGIDIRAVPGTGKAGRVLKGDVETFLEAQETDTES